METLDQTRAQIGTWPNRRNPTCGFSTARTMDTHSEQKTIQKEWKEKGGVGVEEFKKKEIMFGPAISRGNNRDPL